jgi:HAD superfamily hydrolase (TIGR01509 family)
MTPSPPRCLLLDIGMVLVGLDYGPLAEKMRALSGIEPDRLRTVLTAENLVQSYEAGKITVDEFHAEVCRRIGARIAQEDFLEAWYSIFTQPILPDEWLMTLAQKLPMWVLSNTNKLHFEFMTRTFTFLRHFTGFVLSYEVGFLKPDERIFQTALEKVQAPASEVLFVDDQEANVAAARALGIDAFRFLNADQFAAEMKARGLL